MNVKDEDKGAFYNNCHISHALIGHDRLEKKLCSVQMNFERFHEVVSMFGKSTSQTANEKEANLKTGSCLKRLRSPNQ